MTVFGSVHFARAGRSGSARLCYEAFIHRVRASEARFRSVECAGLHVEPPVIAQQVRVGQPEGHDRAQFGHPHRRGWETD